MNYAASLKTARMQLVADLVMGLAPAASTGSPTQGALVIGTEALSGSTGVLATFTLDSSPFSLAGDLLTLADTPLVTTGSAAGQPKLAELRDSSGNVIIGGLTVGLANAHIIISATDITPGGTVTVSSGSFRHG